MFKTKNLRTSIKLHLPALRKFEPYNSCMKIGEIRECTSNSIIYCRFYTFGGFGVPIQGYLGETASFFLDETPGNVCTGTSKYKRPMIFIYYCSYLIIH